ncbi:peptidoglycan-binding protein LysM, partial [Myxococcus sp. AM011]|nr:peptidoglycan-binding protein LysM [Myxococcus sp. AM011]
LAVPQPEQPKQGAVLKRRADAKKQLGPVKLTWAAVPGVERYEVEVARDSEGAAVVTQTTTTPEVTMPALAAGRYWWTVRAVGGAGRSEPSAVRRFELVPERLPINVKKGPWQ